MSVQTETRPRILSAAYWRQSAAVFGDTRMVVFAALIIALRVAVKFLRIPLAAGLEFSFDCYVNALGSLVYGPLMGLAVGAVSDTLGCIIAPSGPYFFPFIFVEMSSSFLFALFLWKRELSVPRILLSKFTVNFISNIVLTSVVMKWNYLVFYGTEKAYPLINLTRIVKNLVLFPLEAILITLLLSALMPALHSLGLAANGKAVQLTKRHILLIVALTAVSVGIVLFYVFFLKDFVSAHNIKWL